MTKIYNTLCKVIFFLFPLVFILPQQFYRNLYQSIPFWIVVISGLFLLPACYKLLKKSGFQRILILFLVYVLTLIIVTLFSTKVYVSLPILLLNAAYFVIFVTGGKILSSEKQQKVLAIIFLAVTALLSAISFYNTFIKGYVSLTSEGLSFMWGYFGHNHLAALLIFAIPICLYFLWFGKGKLLKTLFTILLLFFIYSLLIAFSRGAVLALLGGLILAAAFFSGRFPKKVNYKVILLFGTVIILLILSMGLLLDKKSFRSVFVRSSLWQKGIEMFIQKPVNGFGPGTFSETRIDRYITKKGAFYPHNLLIQNLAEGGVLLFLTTVALFVGVIMSSGLLVMKIDNTKSNFFYAALWVGITSILINEMGDFDMQLPTVGAWFWLLSGMIYFNGLSYQVIYKNKNDKRKNGRF